MINPIDEAHCDLIYGLAVSLKPETVLELGYGRGHSMGSIWQAIGFNRVRTTSYTLLDNWSDHGGKVPDYLAKRCEMAWFKTEILSMEEEDFWLHCPIVPGTLDLLVSDADHGHADKSFPQAVELMRPGGIMIYHDIANVNHPNLNNIPLYCSLRRIDFMIFKKSSREDEQCERGIFVCQLAG